MGIDVNAPADPHETSQRAHPDGCALSVARQPILDRDLRLIGYELLCWDGRDIPASAQGRVQSTSAVILDALLGVGLSDLVGVRRAFVNVSPEFLLSVRPLSLPAENVVLELLDGHACDDELCGVLAELVEKGFTIALDDFRVGSTSQQLLDYARYVKVDLLEHTDAELPDLIAYLRSQRHAPTLIANNVETRETYERCCELGFQGFQGYFFARPRRVEGERVPSEGLDALRMMSDLNMTNDFDELRRVISRDVGLSMRLLRFANSAFVGLPRRVGSIQECLTWLGADAVRQFALMVALSGARNVPSELLVTGLVRARMCQLLCPGRTAAAEDSSFTVGLFSVADALADMPMQSVVEQLPFREDVAAALLTAEGTLGALLHKVIAYQAGEFAAAGGLASARGNVEEIYREALRWADLSFAGLT